MQIYAVTGVTGFVGKALCLELERQGNKVWRLQRSIDRSSSSSTHFVLGEPFDFKQLGSVDVLIHCAYDFSLKGQDDIFEMNGRASLDLMKSAKAAGVKKIIYISSMAAFEGCRSIYGQVKLFVENEALPLGVVVIRPGLVYGEELKGIFGAMAKLISICPLIPVFNGGRQIFYMIHEADLAKALCEIGKGDLVFNAPLILAASQPLEFRSILKKIAFRLKKQIFIFSIPWQMVWVPLKMMELIGLNPPFRSDSLISLLNQDPKPDFTALKNVKSVLRIF